METDTIIFLIVMGIVAVYLVWKMFQNKEKYGTFTNPYRYREYYNPHVDPAKTDYFKRWEETVRQREMERERKKQEKMKKRKSQ